MTSTPPVPEPAPRDCAVEAAIASSVECLWVEAPVDHDNARGRSYDLAVTVLRAASDDPGTPVVYLSGGPGDSSVEFSADWGSTYVVEFRDVILFDQRGTGLSQPDTQCPEIETVNVETLTASAAFEDELASRNAAVAACHERLIGDGVDLDTFSTTASAHDLDLIRQALGYDRWNLWGFSYGTRLALETMRQHPDGIEAVVLDSVYPTTAGTADRYVNRSEGGLEALVRACTSSATCSADQPNLAQDLRDVFDMYHASPIELTLDIDGKPHDFVITGDDLAAGLLDAQADTSLIPALPGIVASFRGGDTSLTATFLEAAVTSDSGYAEGMALATECADNASLATDDDWDEVLADVGIHTSGHLSYLASACSAFPVAAVPASFTTPVTSDISALVMAGSLDPKTPPADSAEAAARLDNATYVEFAHAGHGGVFANECSFTITVDFLASPDTPPDLTCAGADLDPFA